MSLGEELVYPSQDVISDTNMVEFGQKTLVGDGVESLAKIHNDQVSHASPVQNFLEIIHKRTKLSFARSSLAESVLLVSKDVKSFKVSHHMTMDDML